MRNRNAGWVLRSLALGLALVGCETTAHEATDGTVLPGDARDVQAPETVWDFGQSHDLSDGTPLTDQTRPTDVPANRDTTQTVDARCTASLHWCEGTRAHRCNSDGTTDFVTDCAPGVCEEGECFACPAGQLYCNASDKNLYQCDETGSAGALVETCDPAVGCFEERCLACYPGVKQCNDLNQLQICNEDGSAWELLEDCAQNGSQCQSPGRCVNACGTEIKSGTNTGCDFYAVDLENAVEEQGGEVYDAQHAPFAVIISNTSSSVVANITITLPDGTTQTGTVDPLDLTVFNLSNYPQWDYSLEGTGVTNRAFHITTTQPVNVYQFNPLSNVGVFSNDASVLLPTPGLGLEYYGVTLAQISDPLSGPRYRAYVTIVAVSSDQTQVTVTPAASTLAGGGIPALSAGQAHTVTLYQGQVLNIESDGSGDDVDLTGTHVVADKPVAMFSGHVAAVTGGQCCADHLEEQLPPVVSWGTQYVATRAWPRGIESDYWVVVASENGTTVTLNPYLAQVPALDAGESYYFQSDQPFMVTANKPILLTQLLASSYETTTPPNGCSTGGCPQGYSCSFMGTCDGADCSSTAQCGTAVMANCLDGYCQPVGDPSLIVANSVEQFQKSYIFLTPNSYVHDYLNVIAPTGASVTLDNVVIATTSFTPIMNSGYGFYRQEVSDGTHIITSEAPFGIVVYGYDKDVSYGYAGGLGLAEINPAH